MKTTIKTFILCGIGFLVVSCTPQKPPTSSEVYLVVDVTASSGNSNNPLDFTAKKITRLTGLDTDPKSAVKYSQTILSEVHLNQVFSVDLPPANPKKYNKHRRLAKIKRFVSKVQNAVKKLKDEEYDRDSSNLFIALSNILNEVAENDLDRQLVIIQSDLLNNSRAFSAYDHQDMQKLEKSPTFLAELLEQHAPITRSLQKMEVVIVFQPKDTRTDYAFRSIVKQFKAYLQGKGATSVKIVANY